MLRRDFFSKFDDYRQNQKDAVFDQIQCPTMNFNCYVCHSFFNYYFLLPHLALSLVCWAVVVAQLVEQLLPRPEIRGSNHNIGNFFLH